MGIAVEVVIKRRKWTPAVRVFGLAPALAVSRATLYRVAGSRELLLGHVLWTLCEIRLGAARRARTLAGVDGVLEVTRHFCAGLPDAKALIFLEAGCGTTPGSTVDLDRLAYLYTRLVEAAAYA
jgi:hypothetical protein